MRQPTRHDLQQLIAEHQAPCVSLYMPTARSMPQAQQDLVRFRRRVIDASHMLREKYPASTLLPILERLEALRDDESFWKNGRLDGLAVFCSPDEFRVLNLPREVDELLMVSDSFHVKPLVRLVQSADPFHVLCITEREVRLFEGNRYELDEIDLRLNRNVPSSLSEALGFEPVEATEATVAQGSRKPQRPSAAAGKRVESAERYVEEIDCEQFFIVVDRALYQQYSQPTGWPLLLCGLPRLVSLYRSASHNPHLLEAAIEQHPESLDRRQLRQRAWVALEPTYLARTQELIDQYGLAVSRKLGADDLQQVAGALQERRVGTLLVEWDRIVPGRYYRDQGRIEEIATLEAGSIDLLDELAEEGLRTGATVVVLPRERMPTSAGVAAIYRY